MIGFGPRTWRRIERIGVYAAAVILAIYIVFPFLWTFVASFQTSEELFAAVPRIRPHSPWWINYYEVATARRWSPGVGENILQTYVPSFVRLLPRSMLNTVVAGLATVATTLLIGGPCAYSISRFAFPGKGAALAVLLGLRAVPIVAFIVPLFVLMRRIGLTDKLLGLVVVYTALELPFVIWILKEYFASIPRDLDDAALIDGCSRTQVFLRIVLPLMRPGLVVTGVIVFMAMWGAFLVPVILTRSEASITIQAVVAMLIGERDTFTDYGLINAVAVLSLLPPLVLTLIFQRLITSGIFRGAVR